VAGDPTWFECETNGFPFGAGLSSHTANVVGDAIIIIGRDGSARMQRKFGNGYILKGDIASRNFNYTEHRIDLDSRSGHTAHILGPYMIIYGGRNDKPFEQHKIKGSAESVPGVIQKLSDHIIHRKPMSKAPCGRKNHVSASGKNMLVIHGGETFDGRSRDPVRDMFVLTFQPSVLWYKLDDAPIGRSGHTICVYGDCLLLHGGMGKEGIIHGDTYMLS